MREANHIVRLDQADSLIERLGQPRNVKLRLATHCRQGLTRGSHSLPREMKDRLYPVQPPRNPVNRGYARSQIQQPDLIGDAGLRGAGRAWFSIRSRTGLITRDLNMFLSAIGTKSPAAGREGLDRPAYLGDSLLPILFGEQVSVVELFHIRERHWAIIQSRRYQENPVHGKFFGHLDCFAQLGKSKTPSRDGLIRKDGQKVVGLANCPANCRVPSHSGQKINPVEPDINLRTKATTQMLKESFRFLAVGARIAEKCLLHKLPSVKQRQASSVSGRCEVSGFYISSLS